MPTTSITTSATNHTVTLTYPSLVGSTAVGWQYDIERASANDLVWHAIRNIGFDWHTQTIPTTTTLQGMIGCYFYRVRAYNPAGWSFYALVHDLNGNSMYCT